MNCDEAFAFLSDGGFLSASSELGWREVIRAPSGSELAAFVYAIKTLGAWSVGTACHGSSVLPARVEVRTGRGPFDLLFRLAGE